MPLDMNKKITTTTTTSETSELLNKLDSTSILFEENEGNGVTWGTKLMEIRSMFPDAGNYSGVLIVCIYNICIYLFTCLYIICVDMI